MMNLLINKIKKEQKGISLKYMLIIVIIVFIIVSIIIVAITKYMDNNQKTNIGEATVEFIPTKITGSIPYLPTGFKVSTKEGETTLEDGLVIQDNSGNEFVWIAVPNDGTGPNYSKVLNAQVDSDEYYKEIEDALLIYVDDFRDSSSSITDDWSEYQGTTEEALGILDYTELKRKMLKSIYINGGFYVGRYETGYNTGTIRGLDKHDSDYETKAENMISMTTSQLKAINNPVIQKDSYPYNFVTCKQAQGLAESFSSENYTSSLMFGIQWDLMLQYLKINTNKELTYFDFISWNWGNYLQSNISITSENAKQSKQYPYVDWQPAASKKKEDKEILLTTGASDEAKLLNIYDIAGNVFEYTLEYADNETWGEYFTWLLRGGTFDSDNFDNAWCYNAVGDNITEQKEGYCLGFRVTIY